MNLLDYIRAKSSDQGSYLLKDHIIESLIRCKQLYEFVENNHKSIDYNPIKDRELFKNLSKAIILHDLGKVTYDFQKKLFLNDESSDWKKVARFLKPTEGISVGHEILSVLWSVFLLKDSDWDKIIRTAILLHHYNEFFTGDKIFMEIISNYRDDVKKYLEFLVNNSKDVKCLLDGLFKSIKEKLDKCEFIKSAVSDLQKNLNFENVKKLLNGINNYEDNLSRFGELYEIAVDQPNYDFLVFLGLLRRCDYSASANIDVEYPCMRKIFENLHNKIHAVIKNKTQASCLWQKYVLESLNSLNYLVLIAPTGSGKTEFALLWAEKKGKKLIYTLPLRVALNDLYSRFAKSKNAYFNEDFVKILHSTAFLEYLQEERLENSIDVDKKIASAKILSTPVLLSTPDQVFLTSLNYYGSDKVTSVYPISSIVIDEIQAYNAEMAAILIKTLEIIKELKGSILIITATLPPYYEKFIVNNLGFTKLDLQQLGNSLTKKIKNFHVKRHKIKLVKKSLFNYNNTLESGLEFVGSKEFKKELEQSRDKSVIIVVNNVKKAIRIYEEIENLKNVYLLHSRLIEKEKDKRIKEIKEKIKNGEKVILVTTQLVEASVDVDFDVMITEISTIDSQVQRWGRVYRNRGKDYTGELPNIVIFTGDFEEGDLKIDIGTLAVYDGEVIKKTFEVLKQYEGRVLSYVEEREMIKKVFEERSEGKSLKEKYEEKIEEILQFLNYFTVEKKSYAQKLFRRLAGVFFVFPQLMKRSTMEDEEESKILKAFAEIIENSTRSGFSKGWKDIVEHIKNKTNKTVDKWTLKKILYEYSISVPLFIAENIRKTEFKGFYVPQDIKEKDLPNLIKFGLDYIIKNLEDRELQEFEKNQS